MPLPIRRVVRVACLLVPLTACSGNTGPSGTAQGISLTPQWSRSGELLSPTALCDDETRGMIYVAHGEGSIARVDSAGRVVEPGWITGLTAPGGLDCRGDRLWCSDGDAFVEIDIGADSILARHAVPGVGVLTGLAMASSYQILAADSTRHTIWSLEGGVADAWTFTDCVRPCGLCLDGVRLLIGSADCVLAVHLDNKAVERIAEGVRGAVGMTVCTGDVRIIADAAGALYVLAGSDPELVREAAENGGVTGLCCLADRSLLVATEPAADRLRAWRITCPP